MSSDGTRNTTSPGTCSGSRPRARGRVGAAPDGGPGAEGGGGRGSAARGPGGLELGRGARDRPRDPVPPFRRPVVVAVLRQEVASVEGERGAIRGGRARTACIDG